MSDDFDPTTVTWVWDTENLKHLLGAIDGCEEVVIDLETTGLDEHATGQGFWKCPARVVVASLTLPYEGDTVESPPSTWVVPLSHPDSPFLGKWREVFRHIMQTIRLGKKPVINQNMKFDSRWALAHTGVDVSHLIAWDTMQGAHLLDETSPTKLKVRVPQVFDVERWDDFDFSTPGAAEWAPLLDLGMYAARDTYWTWRWADRQRRWMYLHPETREDVPESPDEVELARLGKLATWCAMPMVSTLTAVEQRGMRLDVDWVNQELEEHTKAVAGLHNELAWRYDLDPRDASFAPTSRWFMDWAERACDAGDLRVTAFTNGGKPQWSKGVLLRQARNGSQVAQDLLDLRSHGKKAEYLTSWLTYVTPAGFIHTTYNAARVITGRLSSEAPNVQQVTAVLKPAFIPHAPGWVIIDLDYSQIEMRIAAFISRCQAMLSAFQRGDDLHRMLALKILQLGEEQAARAEERLPKLLTLDDVTDVARQAGKSANFGLLYMMGPAGFQRYAETVYGIAFTPEESVLIHHAFYVQWEGIGDWHARAIARAEATGQIASPLGRVRRLPQIHDGNDAVAAYAQRAAVNAPVQGMASDLMQIAAASIEGTLPGFTAVAGARLIGTVHDDIILEAREDEWERVARECVDRMLGVCDVLKKMGCTFDVPLAVEGKVGTRWGLADVGKVH